MYIVGIAGPVGAGKTTIAKQIKEFFGNVSIISMDNYFKPFDYLSIEQRKKINFDNPNTYNEDLLLEHINQLKNNIEIRMPIYSFENYTGTQDFEIVKPNRVLIIEGYACLFLKRLRQVLDYSIFVDVDEVTQVKRLIDRDIASRGRNLNTILNHFLKKVQVSNKKYCIPQKKYANMIIDGTRLI